MTPFASVFQRMLWLVLVSFLSDYKTLPAFHPSEHTQVNEDEKKSSSDIEFMSWVCASDCVYSNAEKAYTWFPFEDLVLSMSVCNVSLCVYCTWFCPCFSFLLTRPCVCTASDFVPTIRPCHLSLRVYCTWFCLCFTLLSLVPECVLHVISPLLYVPVACPCVCTARDFVANTHCFDMSLQHEPSFFLVSTKPLWHHLSFFWSILVRAEARFITHDVGECKEVTQQVVNYIKCR